VIDSIRQLVVQVADLAEAEGKLLRIEAMRFIKAITLFTIACCLAVSGIGVAAAGGFLLLMEVMHPGLALLVMGGALLMLAIGAWIMGHAAAKVRELRDDRGARHG
jgi:hypothetical protein